MRAVRRATPASPLASRTSEDGGATAPIAGGRPARRPRPISLALGVTGGMALVPLLVWDAWPNLFPSSAHTLLGSIPLATIALLYLLHQHSRRAARGELARAALVAAAFLFWAANQLWADRPLATLFNDVAIAAFVLDLILAIVQPSSASSLAVVDPHPPAVEPAARRAARPSDGH